MVQDIILSKFNEWTRGLDSKEGRIKIFENIRDIPYVLIPELIDPEKGPVGILIRKMGSCSPKHFLMGAMFQKLEIPIKYVTYPFNWNDQDIDYPAKIRKLADAMPIGYHLACRAYINGKWILVDATWDIPLSKAGFPVNESWDGISNTLNAVKPLEGIVHRNAKKSDEEKSLSNRFYSILNKWLEELRTSK